MNIVCGTDFSENALEACRAAAAFAQCLGEPLKLVHALGDQGTVPGMPALPLLYEPPLERLTSQARELAAQFAIDVEPVVLEGTADERLTEFARANHARLLVVSALGSRQQQLWLLGSVAERIVQRSSVPVLVVRDAASIQAWAAGERPLHVVLGVDLGASSKAALRWVESLRRVRPCDVEIVQVTWPLSEHAHFGINGPIELEGLRPELQALLDRDLRAFVGQVEGQGKLSFLVSPSWGRFDHHLASLARDVHADLLVVGAHQRAWSARLWQGSVSRGAVHYGTSNVACVPRTAAGEEATPIQRLRSVLIPTDFSPLANRAIAVGYGLVNGGGDVHLLHVVTRERAEAASELEERLRRLVPRDAARLGITTHLHVRNEVDACSGIEHAATRLAVDAICMSTHGHSGVSELLLGSQAQQVLRRARQPVLLVRAEAD